MYLGVENEKSHRIRIILDSSRHAACYDTFKYIS